MAVDFTPEMREYTNQGKFRYWVQMVLPTIYDDSLSYMELLNKVVYVVNLAIEDVDAVEDNVAALLTAFQDLQQYTNDYFDNLDVQEEINNKLDDMAASGELNQILNPLVIQSVTDWLAQHVTPTSPIVDNTLSISGAAADSKTVGDRLLDDENKMMTYHIRNLTDAGLSDMGVTSVLGLKRNRSYSLSNITTLTDMPSEATQPYNGALVCIETSPLNGWPAFIFVQNDGKTFYGTGAGSTMRWEKKLKFDSTLSISGDMADAKVVGDRLIEDETKINKAFTNYIRNVTNAGLIDLGVENISQFPKNRTYSLSGVTGLTGLPTEVVEPYNGVLACFESSEAGGWPLYIYVTNLGKVFMGTGTGTTIRWDTTISEIQEDYFTNNDVFITNAKLSSMGVSYVRQLPLNRAYHLSNVGKTNLGGMPMDAVAPYNGMLMCFKSADTNGWPGYIYISNQGYVYAGTGASNTDMRWDATHYKGVDTLLANLYNKKIVFIGDSIMYGSHMSDYAAGDRLVVTKNGTPIYNNLSTIVWTAQFIEYLAAQYNCTCVNNSFPGANFSDISANIETLIPTDTDYIIVMLGVNNWSNPQTVPAQINYINSYCNNNNIIPVYLTPAPTKEADYIRPVAQIRQHIKNYNKKGIADFYSDFIHTLFSMNVDINNLYDDNVHYKDNAQPYFLNCIKHVLHL